VDYSFRAELTTAAGLNGMRLSGLVLGVSRNGSFAPRLQFGGDSAAMALFELYGTPPRGAEIVIRLEVARSDDEPALVGAPATLRPGGEDDSRIAVGTVPIASLTPGDYVVRAVLSINGRPAARVARTLRKVRSE
jgi:hypothetical protein